MKFYLLVFYLVKKLTLTDKLWGTDRTTVPVHKKILNELRKLFIGF